MSSQLPSHIKPTIPVAPFNVSIPDSEVSDFKTLLKLSKLAPETYESQHRRLGITSKFMREAKAQWENEYDWRTTEAKLNSLPQFLATVNESMKIHFAAVFSEDKDAIPLVLLHGWPGCFYEYYPLIEELRKSTSPSFHIIAPSNPGYCFSDKPPVEKDYTVKDAVDAIATLMTGLGLDGYIAVGADIGSLIARALTAQKACRGCHGALSPRATPPTADRTHTIPPHQLAGLKRAKEWVDNGRAYSAMHATRPSTIGHVLSSSPLALLAWVGEKILDWTDEDPPIEDVLEKISLYWFTATYPTSIYAYREFHESTSEVWLENFKIHKKFGFSWFPHEVVPQPMSWIRQDDAGNGNLIYEGVHEKGGHFPAFEVPVEFAKDIVGYVNALIEIEKDL
ncbi:putative epoxide hydrolase [Wilcoxina mikolae CBS 423.85]|nr:putative epoxide hydrolase [Wilcoxina mikolae CBS 423.85]